MDCQGIRDALAFRPHSLKRYQPQVDIVRSYRWQSSSGVSGLEGRKNRVLSRSLDTPRVNVRVRLLLRIQMQTRRPCMPTVPCGVTDLIVVYWCWARLARPAKLRALGRMYLGRTSRRSNAAHRRRYRGMSTIGMQRRATNGSDRTHNPFLATTVGPRASSSTVVAHN